MPGLGKHSGNLEKHIRRNHKDRVALLDKEIEKSRQLQKVQKEKKAVLKVKMTPRQLKLACVRWSRKKHNDFEHTSKLS
ncbi:hypothetical protein FOCC_FOCC014779 [Frankliniella occidentalis]|nr:hypothetical protein FOCC_FOCC014779 [Frankliniella occidentalis]